MASSGASKDTSNGADASSEDLLYHIKCEIIDYHEDKSGATRTTNIHGTYTSLPAAKAAARASLKTAGYLPSDFEVYEEKTDPETWKYSDGVFVYAKAPAGQEFRVRLDVKPNVLGLKANNGDAVEEHLHYVLQTIIDYSKDRTGGIQTTEIEGVYLGRKEANHAAYNVLLDEAEGVTKESFAEYERRDEWKDDWPYGEDVMVHAVGKNGENFKVEVKTQLKVHHKREASHRPLAGDWK
jgi:hypothetical protein